MGMSKKYLGMLKQDYIMAEAAVVAVVATNAIVVIPTVIFSLGVLTYVSRML